jgi:hypothetical protein
MFTTRGMARVAKGRPRVMHTKSLTSACSTYTPALGHHLLDSILSSAGLQRPHHPAT